MANYSIPSIEEIKAERARRSLSEFTRQAWHVIEPGTPLLWNWHVDAISDHLQAVTRGQIRKLLINIPPGHAKSLLVTVFWPAWEWITAPNTRNLFASYSGDLSLRDSVRCRDLLRSQWYLETFRPKWEIKGDQDVKSYFVNTEQGFRIALSVGGKGTGFRGDKVIVDDPLNATDQYSILAREGAIFWWDKVMSSRLNDKRKGGRVIIMQRLHGQDLSGHVLEQGGYEHLCLPTEFEPDRRAVTCIGWQDPRTEPGELLFPALFPASVIAEVKKELGDDGYAGQHQQRPAPAEGSILKRNWWRFWCYRGQNLPPVAVRNADGSIFECPVEDLPDAFDGQLQSWDMTFKDTKHSDFVAGGVWGWKQANRYLLDQLCMRMDFTATLAAVREMSTKWPKTRAKLVEDAANGAAVITTLKNEISGLIAVNPSGGKVARAHAAAPAIRSGNTYLPHPSIAPWVHAFIEECAAFPNSKNDDQVDQMTQALNYLETPAEKPSYSPRMAAGVGWRTG